MIDSESRLRTYRRVIEIARDLASTLDLDKLLDRIIHAAADLADAEAASILLYDDAARQLNFQVATNMDLQAMRGLVVPLEGSLAGWAVANRKTVRTANAHEDERFYQDVEQATRYPTRSMLVVPLITKDKVVGVLEVLNKKEGDFNADDEDLLQVVGAQAAVAIENTRLFQQSDLITEFVHELRTPLASIGTSAYLLLRPEISLDQRQSMVEGIHNETMRLNALASSFLDLARLESGRVQYHLTSFDLRSLLEECRQIMQAKAEECHVQIQVKVPSGFPPVRADCDKLKQVVLNLVSNAIKYNRENGSIFLAAAKAPRGWILTIRDTGIGIPAKSLPHLFEKFYRVQASENKAVGTGLGLSICKQIVSGHGGSIEVRSTPGEGTEFRIHMPDKKD